MTFIFITGTSSGVGRETARLFAQKGWQVIATTLHLATDGDLANMANITIMPLDVTDSSQIGDTCQTALK